MHIDHVASITLESNEVTPLLKPTSDPDIPSSPDHSILVHSTKPQTHNRVVHFFKAFCIPGVAVVRHGIDFMQCYTHMRL